MEVKEVKEGKLVGEVGKGLIQEMINNCLKN